MSSEFVRTIAVAFGMGFQFSAVKDARLGFDT